MGVQHPGDASDLDGIPKNEKQTEESSSSHGRACHGIVRPHSVYTDYILRKVETGRKAKTVGAHGTGVCLDEENSPWRVFLKGRVQQNEAVDEKK